MKTATIIEPLLVNLSIEVHEAYERLQTSYCSIKDDDKYNDLVNILVDMSGGSLDVRFTDPQLADDYEEIMGGMPVDLSYNEALEDLVKCGFMDK